MYQTLFNPKNIFGADVFSPSARIKMDVAAGIASASATWGGGAAVVGLGVLGSVAALALAGAVKQVGGDDGGWMVVSVCAGCLHQ